MWWTCISRAKPASALVGPGVGVSARARNQETPAPATNAATRAEPMMTTRRQRSRGASGPIPTSGAQRARLRHVLAAPVLLEEAREARVVRAVQTQLDIPAADHDRRGKPDVRREDHVRRGQMLTKRGQRIRAQLRV